MVHLDVVPAFPPVRVLAALLVLVACGDSSGGTASGASTGGTDGASTAPTSTAATEDPGESTTASACAAQAKATDDCCCFSAMTDESNNLNIRDDCPIGASECASIAATCMEGIGGPDCAAGDSMVDDSQAPAVTCVVNALRTGAPARVGWEFVGIPGFSGGSVTLYIAGDQTVFRLPNKFEDLSNVDGPVERFTLPPAAFFDDCAAMATTTQQFECLKGFLDGAAIETCSPG